MNKAYLLIGGNIGEREIYLERARIDIEKRVGKIVIASSIYQTAAWGIEDQSAFLNQVLLIETTLNATQLLQQLLSIEEDLGRKRTVKFGPRTIDLDILLFNNDIINQDNLKVPHPALPDRRFALVPLSEIAPDLHHPVLHKSIEQLLDECSDKLPIVAYI